MKQFIVHLNKIKIRTGASDADQAVRQVLDFEMAPESAVIGVYQDNPTPDVFSKYGAPMGRMSKRLEEGRKWTAARLTLDDGGYDNGGAYWGLRPSGSSLYAVQDGMGNLAFVDAASKKEALEKASS